MQDALRKQVNELSSKGIITKCFLADTINLDKHYFIKWSNGVYNMEYGRLHKLKKVVGLFLYDLQ